MEESESEGERKKGEEEEPRPVKSISPSLLHARDTAFFPPGAAEYSY